jgi:hypothetical protein
MPTHAMAQDVAVGFVVEHYGGDPTNRELVRQELESYLNRELSALSFVRASPQSSFGTQDVVIRLLVLSLGGEAAQPFIGRAVTIGVFERCVVDLGQGPQVLADHVFSLLSPAVLGGSVPPEDALTTVGAVGNLCSVESRRTIAYWPPTADMLSLVRSAVASIDTAVLQEIRRRKPGYQ